MNTSTPLTFTLDPELLEDFQGLMEHIGLETHEALAEAMRAWVNRNAVVYGYGHGTEVANDGL